MQKAYILGNPRSGTTLLRLLLNAHPAIIAPPECGFMHWWYSKYKDWNGNDSNSTPKINEYVEDLFSSKKIETWELQKQVVSDKIQEEKPTSYSLLSEIIYQAWGKQIKKNSNVIIDKNNYYIHHLEDLIEIWPDAKFIFLVRDGRDVACSYRAIGKLKTDSVYKPKLPQDIQTIAKKWSEDNIRIDGFLNNLPDENYRVVRYEDILSNPQKSMQKVLELFQIPFNEKMLSFYKNKGEPRSTIDWKEKTLEKIDSRNSNKFEKILSIQEIKEFQKTAQKALLKFNYKLIG